MIRTLHLHGRLADICGTPHQVQAHSIRDCGGFLCANFKEAIPVLAKGRYHIVRGSIETGHGLEADDEIGIGLGRTDEVHFVPVIDGARGGVGKAVLGAALIGAAAYGGFAAGGLGASVFGQGSALAGITYGNLLWTGVSMGLAGAAQLLSPQPEVADYRAREAPDQRASFLLNGPTNTVEEGQAIPLVFGRAVRVGSITVSAGIAAETISHPSDTVESGGVPGPAQDSKIADPPDSPVARHYRDDGD